MHSFYLLLADDDVDIGILLTYYIRLVYKDRVSIKSVRTVPELLDVLSPTAPVPDLLLLDYHLKPEPLKATDVLIWMHQQNHLADLPVNVWSSLPDGPEADRCRQLGALSFTTKADAFDNMSQFVKNLVENSSL
ncbi:hypothetical protein ACO2Q8_19370 [Larkinella sp. VNQ87]|uniref:hypothetical protein n=1 Tax=Larkinella sp. VNQ87 TaxID=3400921 RepID=UPI003C043229